MLFVRLLLPDGVKNLKVFESKALTSFLNYGIIFIS